MRRSDSQHTARLAAYGTVSTRLSLMSDRRLGEVVAAAAPHGSGIGGRTAELELDGVPVFVKRVPLTDLELRPENLRSTANLFGLPMFYHYGIGSAGFGAWRELAVHTMTTNWVLQGAHEGFPLTYHWRVLPDSAAAGVADGFGGIDQAVAHWQGSSAVRERLEAIGRSSSSLVLFLEHVPQTLAAWLASHQDAATGSAQGSPYPWLAAELERASAFMSSRGLVHFDAHFANLLTDGRLLYFADFGLALSTGFELRPTEAEFLTDHLGYDGYYTTSHLLHHHLPEGVRGGTEQRLFLREWIAGRRPDGVPRELAAILDRSARAAVFLDEFHRRLLNESKRTPFPAAELGRLAATVPAGRPR
ncbi:protein kinase family protein [Kitasatospora sp. NBC_01266]|uniref:protein kinase family protein n=1 Tax=Kitasatospora sp. NBC_01266 TaxID=2903572 RepID=UPI002E3379A1|nr:protein kinase family protein [Kitasatospora sp. NBC_01266]